MPLFDHESWKKNQKVQKTKRNLVRRQRELVRKLRARPSKFDQDEALRTELRRVANLCVKLDVRLFEELERHVLKGVMES